MKHKTFNVLDRESGEILSRSLTAVEVVHQHVQEGHRSASIALIQHMREGQRMTLGPVVVETTVTS